MKQEGNFILLTVQEFEQWLLDNNFKRPVKIIQNHHTWRPNYSGFKKNNHFELVKAMENYHINSNKWDEIAQNITTFPDGTLMICRSFEKMPIGIVGANPGAICIEHIGDFDIGQDEMNEGHRNAIISINALLCKKFNLKPSTDSIVYHHWYDRKTGKKTGGTGDTKTCPGTNFFGGNTIENAQANFIPLVQSKLNGANKNEVKEINILPSKKATVNVDGLRIRTSPEIKIDNIIGKLKIGEQVNIFMESNGWSKINEQSAQWVSTQYLKIVPTEN